VKGDLIMQSLKSNVLKLFSLSPNCFVLRRHQWHLVFHVVAAALAGSLLFAMSAQAQTGVVTTLGGTAGSQGSSDGTGATASFDHAWAVASNLNYKRGNWLQS